MITTDVLHNKENIDPQLTASEKVPPVQVQLVMTDPSKAEQRIQEFYAAAKRVKLGSFYEFQIDDQCASNNLGDEEKKQLTRFLGIKLPALLQLINCGSLFLQKGFSHCTLPVNLWVKKNRGVTDKFLKLRFIIVPDDYSLEMVD